MKNMDIIKNLHHGVKIGGKGSQVIGNMKAVIFR